MPHPETAASQRGGLSGGPAQLRSLMSGRRLIAAPGAFDPFTARIIESIGFPAVYLGGNAIGLHLCAGQPMITLTETVECARRVLGAINAPLIVDAGAGFGEPAHTHRAVRELERAGIAAIHIDDQPYPKRAHYHVGQGGLAPAGHVVDRLSVALQARRNPDFMIFARTDALRVTRSIDETVERCRAYVETGVDALMVLDLAPDQAAAIRRQLPGTPLAWFVSPSIQAPSLQELEAAGFKLALYPFNTVAAIAEAVTATWVALHDGGRLPQSSMALGELRDSVQRLIGMPVYWDIERSTFARDDTSRPCAKRPS
jgi:2-methylisocitrate lyase-like PEP mutase family enzyme